MENWHGAAAVPSWCMCKRLCNFGALPMPPGALRKIGWGLREFSFFVKRTPRFRASGRVSGVSSRTRSHPDAQPSNQDEEWAQV